MTGIAFGESPRRPPAGRRREGLGESAAQARAARCNRGSRRRLATATQGPTSFPGFSSWPDRPFETLLVVALAERSWVVCSLKVTRGRCSVARALPQHEGLVTRPLDRPPGVALRSTKGR